ncbi:MAG: type II toxin-antitoxin system HicB family antitoxin [Pseudomonadota bacterium]
MAQNDAKVWEYDVILTPDEGDTFSVSVPALPEVCTFGDSVEDALDNAREAIELVIEVKRDFGEPVPVPASVSIRKVAVEAAE